MHNVLPHLSRPLVGTVPLVASKSESNRALILQALSAGRVRLSNLSQARDTVTLQGLLQSGDPVLDARDAGTTMRFLTAYCAAAGRPALLTGTPRMLERPIGILLDALRELGADITCEGVEGFPPHRIHSFHQRTAALSIRGDVSSQFVSALLLIAPFLPMGLHLTLTGRIASRPYIDMTVRLLQQLGGQVTWEGQSLWVPPQELPGGAFTVESDWSAAGYWYAAAALAPEADLKLLHLRADSLQGDRALAELMRGLGVESTFEPDGVRLRKTGRSDDFCADFSDIPDQAQTFAVLCAALGIPARLTGLASLRIKETDRIFALQTELARFGCALRVEGDDTMEIPAQALRVNGQSVKTYDDHRMAMAFAPLAFLGPLTIEDPEVVAKSYPTFWQDWDRLTAQV